MVTKVDTNKKRLIRHKRVRAKLSGTSAKPRLCVFRSNTNIYAQIIDDISGTTLLSASSLDKEMDGYGGNKEAAKKVGALVAKKAAEKGVGVIAIHTAGGGKLLRYGVRMEDLLRYALSYPVTTAVVSVSEIWHVEENVMSAANFKSMTVEEKSKLENIFSPKK